MKVGPKSKHTWLGIPVVIDPQARHAMTIEADGIVQCLGCGYWTRQGLFRLNEQECQEPESKSVTQQELA